MNVEEKLAQILRDTGWSQEHLAQVLGVPFATVNRWINSRSKPRAEALRRIDDLYLGIAGTNEVDEKILQELKAEAMEQQLTVRELLEDRRMLDRLVLHLTYHTNNIEGSTMTLADVREVLSDRDKVLANKTAREQIEARNHRSALYYLLDELNDQGEDFMWSEELICGVHLRLMNSIIDNAGQWRRHGVMILNSKVVLAEAEDVPRLMGEYVEKLNREVCCMRGLVGNMARLHAEFEKIHPFSDGNGRVGRLIMLAQALRSGVVPPLVLRERKKVYYKCLGKAQREKDFLALEQFMAESILTGDEMLRG